MPETYRNVRPDDFDDLSVIARDWSIVRQLGGWKWPYDPDQIRARSKPYEGEGFVWAICRDDRLIGCIGVTGGDLGYMLRADMHGQGIVSRAAFRAVGRAFEDNDRDHLTGSTWHDNPGSARLLEKLGFEHWQSNYMRSLARGIPTLVHHRRLTRARWDRLRMPAQ